MEKTTDSGFVKTTAEEMESNKVKVENVDCKSEIVASENLEACGNVSTMHSDQTDKQNHIDKDSDKVSQVKIDLPDQVGNKVKTVSAIQEIKAANVNIIMNKNLASGCDNLSAVIESEDLARKSNTKTEKIDTLISEGFTVLNEGSVMETEVIPDVNILNTNNTIEDTIKPVIKINIESNSDMLSAACALNSNTNTSEEQQSGVKRTTGEVNQKVQKKMKKKLGEASKNDSSTVISNGKVCGNRLNSSLNQIMNYSSGSSDFDSSDEEIIMDNSAYRQPNQPFSDNESDNDSESCFSSSSSSTSSSFSYISDCMDSDGETCGAIKKTDINNKKPLKTKGELTLDDLPPVEHLKISVPEEECRPIGKVFQIVDQIVVIQTLKQTPVLDLDSALFTEGGQCFGQVFDVFGPVSEPYYCVRFNNNQEILDKKIAKGQTVYAAPKTKYTSYVFVSQLMNKGSDASWVDNNEPPKHCLDYSDDEEERLARKSHQPTVKSEVVDVDEPVRKRPNAYEQRMNELNLRISARAGVPKGRGRSFPRGEYPLKSDIIWPPGTQPPRQSLLPQSCFMNRSPFSSPVGFQIGGSPFSPLSSVNHFSSTPVRPVNHPFESSSLPPPSPVNHQFGNVSFQPPINHQFPSSPMPPPSPQFGSSPFHGSVNHQFGSSLLPPPSPVSSGSSFQTSMMPPPPQPPGHQFGNSLPQSEKYYFGNSSLQQPTGSHFGKAPGSPVSHQFGIPTFPQPPSIMQQVPAVRNTTSLQFSNQGSNPNQFWTQSPAFPLQRNNFKH